MEFSVIKKQSEHFAPSIFVRFPDGYTDRLILWKHYYNEEDRMTNEHADDCHYFGHLAKEKDACAAVSGCLGEEEILFSIMSVHAPGSTNFVWTKEGDIHILDKKQMVSNRSGSRYRDVSWTIIMFEFFYLYFHFYL